MSLKCDDCNIDLRVRGSKQVNNTYIIRKKVCPQCKKETKTIEIKEDIYNNTFGFVTSLQNFLRTTLNTDKKE
jgi:transcriptional regulator NrdR family protein